MSERKKEQIEKRRDILFVGLLVFFVALISMFNYFMDPYYIFRDSTINGINNVKTHKYSNKRTIIYSDIKLNSKNKDIAFTGNCLLSHYGTGLDNVAFFTIPVAKVEEVADIIKNLNILAPDIKKIYWGLFYDDFWNTPNAEVNDSLQVLNGELINIKDFINLFFSWNTTKYSIDTLKDSIKTKGKDIIYVYPYREIAKKSYDREFTYESLERIEEIKQFAKKKGIEIVIYYSPIHVSKKIHIYTKGMWESNQELKKRLAKITPFYDYSFFNEYNYQILDENNYNFVDNIHPTNTYNNIIVNDLLANDKKVGVLVNQQNVNELLDKDTKKLIAYINDNKELVEKIQNVSIGDSGIKIRRKDAI